MLKDLLRSYFFWRTPRPSTDTGNQIPVRRLNIISNASGVGGRRMLIDEIPDLGSDKRLGIVVCGQRDKDLELQ